jgi:hypothetical protein
MDDVTTAPVETVTQADNVHYDEQRIFERAAVIQVAIDARHQKFPDEPRFAYRPFAGREDEFRFNDQTFEAVIKDYFTKDLAI